MEGPDNNPAIKPASGFQVDVSSFSSQAPAAEQPVQTVTQITFAKPPTFAEVAILNRGTLQQRLFDFETYIPKNSFKTATEESLEKALHLLATWQQCSQIWMTLDNNRANPSTLLHNIYLIPTVQIKQTLM